MTTSSEPMWWPWVSAGNLAFRGACNAALDVERRPVRPRVIDRISQAAEAVPLFNSALQAAQVNNQAASPQQFFEHLSVDPQWQTLVAEFVARERSWADLFNPELRQKLGDWFLSFVEKSTDKHHPVARIVSAVLVSMASLGVVSQVRYVNKVITVPIRTILLGTEPLQVKAEAADGGLPVRVTPATGAISLHLGDDAVRAGIPLKLAPGTALDPIRVEVRSAPGPETALAKQLLGAARQVADVSKSLKRQDLSTLNVQNARDVTRLFAAIERTSSAADKLTEAADELIRSQESAAQQFDDLRAFIQLTTTRTDPTPPQRTLTMAEGTSQVVEVPTVDTITNQIALKWVTACVGKIRKQADGTLAAQVGLREGALPECAGLVIRRQGAATNTEGALPWQLTINALTRGTLWRRGDVTLTLSATQGGSKAAKMSFQTSNPGVAASR